MIVFEFFDHFLRRDAVRLIQTGDEHSDNDCAENKGKDDGDSCGSAKGDDLRHSHCCEVGRQTDELKRETADLIGEGFILLDVEEVVRDRCSKPEDGKANSLQDLGLR